MTAGQIALEIFLSSLLTVFLWVGFPILIGFLIALGNNFFYKFTGTASKAICITTGVLGVPLHELGHALFCLIFGHKIVEIKLFQPSAPDGVLGYVNHTYNPKNFYQKMGNFFIGMGPILLISGIIILLEWLLVPSIFQLTASIQNSLSNGTLGVNVFWAAIIYLKNFFNLSSLVNWRWWIYVIISCLICLHMNLSKPDIKGSLSGLFFTIIIFFIIPIVAAFFDLKDLAVMASVTHAMTIGAIYFDGVLVIAVTFVYLLVIITGIIAGIVKLIKTLLAKKKNPNK